eukprot:GEMP01027391.1.p1 GENE.GEMP01027391.1~~GEMP01027391.1.p1  ORF type:complete len:418 (+),score=107.35 GEMP01027391.1:26-1255(+)
MEAGFFNKPAKGNQKPKEEDTSGRTELDDAMLDTMVEVFKQTLTNSALNELETRVRMGTGAKEGVNTLASCCGDDGGHDHDHDHGHKHDHSDSDEERDTAGDLLRKYISKIELRKMVPVVLDTAGTMFLRVKKSGERDGLSMSEALPEVQQDVLKETLLREIQKRINTEASSRTQATCNDAFLLAQPQGFQGELDTFTPDQIHQLMTEGYVVVDNVCDDGGESAKEVFSALEHLDFGGKFQNVIMQMLHDMRNDKRYFFHAEDIISAKQKGFGKVMKLLMSIPFELNMKCGLFLQVTTAFEATYFPVNGYHKKWFESGYDGNDIGRKISAVYFTSSQWLEGHGGKRRVYRRKKMNEPETDEVVAEIAPIADRLLVFRSRDMAQEVLKCNKKRYELTLHTPGPAGPGDDK